MADDPMWNLIKVVEQVKRTLWFVALTLFCFFSLHVLYALWSSGYLSPE